MAEGSSQEKFFWDSYPWVLSGSSCGGSGEGGREERSSSEKSLRDLRARKNDRQIKHPETGDMDGSSGGDHQDALATTPVGSKKHDDAFEIENEFKTAKNFADAHLSLHNNDKAKREVVASDHELHILTERERRKKMRNMFHQLHALMPHLPQKADKAAVVDEAVRYIKTLQQTLQKLETKKLQRLYGPSNETTTPWLIQPQRTSIDTRESFIADQGTSTNNIINGRASPSSSTTFSLPLCSKNGFQTWVSSNVTLNVCGRDALISVCSSHKPGLLTAICFVLEKNKLEIVSAQISSENYKSLFMIHAQANYCDQFMKAFHYDEIYKQAASEITQWVNSESS